MKKVAIIACLGLAVVGGLVAEICWRQQRQAIRAQLIDADEAIRTLDQYSEQQYSGGPTMDLTQADLRARDKVAILDHGYHTEKENSCGVSLSFELSTVESRVSIRRSLYETATIKGTPDAFKEAQKDWPAPTTAQNPCIDDLRK